MSKNKQILMIYLFLTMTTLMVFWRVTACDFINYDDQGYVTENQHVQNGLTLEGIRWAFTTGAISNWHPVTWISHMMDVQLFGLQPRWHHFMNLLFHVANTLLLFFVLHRMTKARWESAFVAALFALHPLHVESVAWVAERRDVLSTFFWFLTMGAYCWYAERPGLQRYLLVVLFFALGLMSKPMLVTLPFALLLMDYWPLQRFRKISDRTIRTTAVERPVSGDKQKGKKKRQNPAGEELQAARVAVPENRWAMIRPLFLEKIPLFALTALSSIVTYLVQQQGGAVSSFETMPLGGRIANAFVSYVIYIGKTIWPNDLAIIYPHPLSLPAWQVLGAVLVLTAVTVMAIWKAGRFPYLATGWLWFAGTLVPVIGLVQVGIQARADRYTYVSLIGLFIIAAWGISELSRKWRYRKEILIASSTTVLLGLCIVTWTQVGYWRNSITLFDHTLNVTDNNFTAYYNRGTAYWHLGNFRQAVEDFDKVIEINPNEPEYLATRGNANLFLGNYRQAIGDFDTLIGLDPKNADIYNKRGYAYWRLGSNQQAIGDYDRALSINPNDPKAYDNRGNYYLRLGNYQQAIGDYDKALSINPKDAEIYYNRGYAYSRLGNDRRAIEDLKTAAGLGYKNAQDLLMSKGMR